MSERKLQLADSCRDDETSSIDVLLGSDLFWECILPEKVSIEKGLFAINSVFGWVVVAGANLLRHGEQNCSQNIAVMKNVAVMNDLELFGELDSIAEGITWKFIVELAPWWGGFYERLMRSIKEPLRKIIGRANLTFEETMTILAEIENVLNRRPLTYVSDDVSGPEALTLANFLLVGHKNDYPFNFSELLNNSITRESLLKRKYYQTKLLSQFWKKWKDNYLLNIRSFHHFPKPSVERNLRVGDVVILEGNTKSKFLWDLGRIAKVMQGSDGLVRSCVVKTKKGEFKRPVQLIYPLELSET
ncbi:putative pao retrotransposon peptidase superfamily [Trichonephila clavata]|uniref:Putative pao retrotransposon peptidase superfamily n=1 Tax=Trichonephila clavata TaxID=2740835 RepID=A0A8X6FFC8_TRICU|nr:putative pao retrotransposon peptidase superfamily [Trichonephila clavata]